MSTRITIYKIPAVLLAGTLASCGGGSGGGDSFAGIGGTGINATGTIDGFGSIFVNGIEFETGTATVVLDGDSASEDDLRLGMVVTLSGTVDDDGITGTAESVEFDDDIQGPISAITVNADGNEKTLMVFDITILVDQTSTVFDDVTFDTLAIDDVIEVSGFFDGDGVLQATRVEKKDDFVANQSEIEVKGQVSALSGTVFTLGSLTVDFSSADLSDVPGGTLLNGMRVEVEGTLSGTAITATEIEQEDEPFDDDEENVSLEGLITDFVDAANFNVAGQAVDASGAELDPTGLVLEDGLLVEVEGDIVNGVLIAEEVEARAGEVELSASVQALDIANGSGTITLGFAAGNVSFEVNSQTELDDETDTFDPLSLSDLRTGDFLEVEALLSGSQLIATEVRLEEPDDELVQGPVESFVSGGEITILGLTFQTAGAEFEDDDDQSLTPGAFFSQLDDGDLVKITDDLPADGVADEVEFED